MLGFVAQLDSLITILVIVSHHYKHHKMENKLLRLSIPLRHMQTLVVLKSKRTELTMVASLIKDSAIPLMNATRRLLIALSVHTIRMGSLKDALKS